jgi:vacuole morphology and inheritance protein 14
MLEETGTPAESPLPPAILRGLGDRSYDKRKTAALDVTALIKSLQEAGGQILYQEQ